MNFTTTSKERHAVVRIDAEKLGGVISPQLKALFVELNNDGNKNILLDMSNARYCDSSGLSAILVGNRLCKNADGSFVICGVTEMVMKLIEISQLQTVLNITSTAQEGEDFIMMEEVGRDVEKD